MVSFCPFVVVYCDTDAEVLSGSTDICTAPQPQPSILTLLWILYYHMLFSTCSFESWSTLLLLMRVPVKARRVSVELGESLHRVVQYPAVSQGRTRSCGRRTADQRRRIQVRQANNRTINSRANELLVTMRACDVMVLASSSRGVIDCFAKHRFSAHGQVVTCRSTRRTVVRQSSSVYVYNSSSRAFFTRLTFDILDLW